MQCLQQIIHKFFSNVNSFSKCLSIWKLNGARVKDKAWKKLTGEQQVLSKISAINHFKAIMNSLIQFLKLN